MKRKQEHKIEGLLDQFVRAYNLEQGLAEYRVRKAWSEVLGKNIANATKSLYIKDGKLFVILYSSVVRNELSLLKSDIIKKLNEEARKEVIKDIILR